MTLILRAALLATSVAASVPAVASGQEMSADSLLRRIDLLEHRTAELERQVRELEALIKVEPARSRPNPGAPAWHDLGNWRRLRSGMSMDQVQAVLGEPDRVDAGRLTFWYYGEVLRGGGNVIFNGGKVEGWSEPRPDRL